jgi:molybdopterin/thiamine biosynthesis adenylyltransferase
MLFDHADVNRPKVLVAEEKLKRDHLINKNTVIVAYNMCALENWSKIVELSKEATVIFNMIDVGEYFDAAVQALCYNRRIPLI